jgi:hypothetical protein
MQILGEGCYCCLCFDHLRVEDAYTQPNGIKIDVHLKCAAEEKGIFAVDDWKVCMKFHHDWYQNLSATIHDVQYSTYCPICEELRIR